MRFHVGPIPETPDFHPAETGWTPLREPSAMVFSLLGGIVGLGLGAAAIALWVLVLGDMSVRGNFPPGQLPLVTVAIVLGTILGGLALLIIVHELLHAAVFP